MAAYVDEALSGQRAGHMLPWVVRELANGAIIGTTRYHDIVAGDRSRRDRLHVVREALAAKPREHGLQAPADDARVRDARLQGRRAAHGRFNFASQRAIERAGRAEGRR